MVQARRREDSELQEIHDLVDQLPKKERLSAKRYLQYLRDIGDPLSRAFRDAPIDDEPESAEERAAVREANKAITAGRTISHKALKKKLGL